MRATPLTDFEIRVFAPAKLNLHLTVERRRPDGFHDIHTIFQTIDFGDDLFCRALRRRECRIECDDPRVPLGPRNLIERAWRLLADAFPDRIRGLHVRLVKRIPMGAGLGGGSSDASAALAAVARLYGLPLRRSALLSFAAALGSDCAFFLRGGAALGTGRGEILTPLRNRLGPASLVIVYPGFPSDTAQAYRRLGPEHWQSGADARRVARAIERGDWRQVLARGRNIFDRVIVETDSRYKKVRDQMKAEGLYSPSLTGSGSAMFAFAPDRDQAKKASDRLKRAYPVVVCASLRAVGVRVYRVLRST